jgi:hypothetical protein
MSSAEQMEVLVVQNPAQSSSTSHVALEMAQAEFFAGTVDDDGARVLLGDRSKPCPLRTLERFIADGLPHIKYGNKRRFIVARMREWMMARERCRSRAPRARGRPSREVAAARIATPVKAPGSLRSLALEANALVAAPRTDDIGI